MGSNWSRPYDQTISFQTVFWEYVSYTEGTTFGTIANFNCLCYSKLWKTYSLQTYNQRIMHKTHRDHIIPHLHTLIGFLHQNAWMLWRGHFMALRMYVWGCNLRQWKFYKKLVTEMQHQKIWGYEIITTKNYLWMVEHCASVTPRPTQKRAFKTLFQLGLVVSVINTLRRGHCIELLDILFAS